MDVREWPTQDREWVARYQSLMVGQHVPAVVVEERQRELLDSVRAAGLSAIDLFGDADELATEDAIEFSSTAEAVLTSEGGGLKRGLREVGGTLLALGMGATALLLLRNGWFVDVDIASLWVVASVLVLFVGWTIIKQLFAAGLSIPSVGAVVATGALACGGMVVARNVGVGHIAASDVSVPLLGFGLLTPGVVALLTASRLPQPILRETWSDEEWLRRFRAGLRARLVPAVTAHNHVTEIEQTMRSETTSISQEFGHPLVLSRELAGADRAARARLWWASTIVGTGTPLVIAALILTVGTWGALTIPLAVVLLLSSVLTPALGWKDQPQIGKR